MPSAPVTRSQRLLAAVLAAGPGAVVSHASAAVLLGIPGFRGGRIEVSRPRRRHDRGLVGTVHEVAALPAESLTMRDGIPVTTVSRTLCDLAARLKPQRLARIVDASIAARLVTLAELQCELERLAGPGRAGVAAMRKVLAERGECYVPAESELEQRFLELVDAAGLPRPRKQVVLVAGRVDFVFADARLVVELDGRQHMATLSAQEDDRRRDAELVADGWRPIRITWRRLHDEPRWVLTTLLAALGLR